MQPYLFPYIGYFQLINHVDKFVIFDDVQYIKRGWINRNYILLDGEPHLFTFPVKKASQNKLINEMEFFIEEKKKEKFIKLLRHAYSKAPYFNDVLPLIKEIVLTNEADLVKFIELSLKKLTAYLNIDTSFMKSSQIPKSDNLQAQNQIIEICETLEAKEYINLIGGKEIYDPQTFEEKEIDFYFIKSKEIKYNQFNNKFVPNLSIIDILMFNSINKIDELLKQYELLK